MEFGDSSLVHQGTISKSSFPRKLSFTQYHKSGFTLDNTLVRSPKLTIPNRSLVLSTLRPLLDSEPDRKCYRQIGGTLVERTVKDVVPTLETNFSGIKEVLEGLAKQYKSREEEFVGFQKEYGIQVSLFASNMSDE